MSRLLPILVVLAAFPVDLHAAEPVVKLELSSTRIRECDPISCRVTLINPSDKTLTVGQSIGTGPGTLRFEVLDRDANWMHVPLTNQGLVCSTLIYPLRLKPQSSLVEYEQPFLTRDGEYYFAYAGKYEIRAGVRVDKRLWYSEPVLVTVDKIPKIEREYMERNIRSFGRYVADLRSSISPDADLAFLREAEERLSDSEVKRQIQWQLQYSALTKATPAELDKQLSVAKQAADKLPEHWKIPACSSLARFVASERRYDLIETALAGIDDDWNGIAGYRTLLRHQEEDKVIVAEALTQFKLLNASLANGKLDDVWPQVCKANGPPVMPANDERDKIKDRLLTIVPVARSLAKIDLKQGGYGVSRHTVPVGDEDVEFLRMTIDLPGTKEIAAPLPISSHENIVHSHPNSGCLRIHMRKAQGKWFWYPYGW